MQHPPGTVGILSGEQTRWAWFAQSLLGLALPPGSQILWVQGLAIPAAVNTLIREMRPEDAWIQLWADDHLFDPEITMHLLNRHVDVVAPLCCLRRLPYAPSLFHATNIGYVGYTWEELEGQAGLVAVDTFGGPGVVIRREVIEVMGQPFFQCMRGQLEAPHEDLYCFDRCRQAGFQPYVDLDLPIGHILPAAVYPHRCSDGEYRVRLWSTETLTTLRTYERKAVYGQA